jgi:hypothetical protein
MKRLRTLLRKTRTKLHHHGLPKLVYVGLLKAVSPWVMVLRGHYVEEVDPAFLRLPRNYSGSFLTPDALAQFTRDAEAGLPAEFVEYALRKGDKCYGFTQNGALRSYGWYANNPTRVSRDLKLHFGRQYMYMYKGFTHELHRGKRLFPLGMTQALKLYRAAGYKGMLLYVDAFNLDSLKSCARMGFHRFGSIYIARILDRYFVFETPGCARFGFRVELAGGHGSRAARFFRIVLPASSSP